MHRPLLIYGVFCINMQCLLISHSSLLVRMNEIKHAVFCMYNVFNLIYLLQFFFFTHVLSTFEMDHSRTFYILNISGENCVIFRTCV